MNSMELALRNLVNCAKPLTQRPHSWANVRAMCTDQMKCNLCVAIAAAESVLERSTP